MHRPGWEKEEYTIQMQLDGRIFGEIVSGITKGGFGVHETDAGWNVTHVASGWNCFTAVSEDGAVILADYLMENYHRDFDRLKISGTELENYKQLETKIKTDPELKTLVRLFAIESETKPGPKQLGVKIIS